jgi:peptide/nickel transport system substrate-binding protein
MKLKKLAAFGCLLLLFACSRTNDQVAIAPRPADLVNILRFTDTEDLTTLNPLLANESNVSWLSELTMAFLLRYDSSEKPIPELATVVPTLENGGISHNGKTITWHIRHNVQWSDGAPFNADDVVFTTRTILNDKNNITSRDGWDLITKIDEPDRYTVIFHLSRAYGSFIPTFFTTGGSNPCILPKHLLSKYPSINQLSYNRLPIGIGPFKYLKWDQNEQVVMVPNDLYWRGKPKLDKIIYKVLSDKNTTLTQIKTGEIDMWIFPGYSYYSQLRVMPSYHTFTIPGYYYDHLDFNMEGPITSDVAVRNALELAVDRFTMNEKVGQGLGIVQESIFSPASSLDDWSLPTTAFDITKANALLEKDGWHLQKDGFRYKNEKKLPIQIVARSSSPDDAQRMEIIRDGWLRIGVEMQSKLYSAPLLFDTKQNHGILANGKYDAAIFAWGGSPDQDQSAIIAGNQFPPFGQNYTHYNNADVNHAVVQSTTSYDAVMRKRDAHIIQWQIARDTPTVVLDYRRDLYAVNDHVNGFHPNATSPFDDMMNVSVK